MTMNTALKYGGALILGVLFLGFYDVGGHAPHESFFDMHTILGVGAWMCVSYANKLLNWKPYR